RYSRENILNRPLHYASFTESNLLCKFVSKSAECTQTGKQTVRQKHHEGITVGTSKKGKLVERTNCSWQGNLMTTMPTVPVRRHHYVKSEERKRQRLWRQEQKGQVTREAIESVASKTCNNCLLLSLQIKSQLIDR
ncbi:hypothetical protein M514_01933, partial [Trichuris suis]